jgi:CO/xanthine dehydrogenase Mo-binding subunit
MIDELAHAAGQDALAFRRNYLTHPNYLGVVDAVASAATWERRVSASNLSNERKVIGRGIAVGQEGQKNSDVYSAVVAEVVVDRKTGVITVKHIYGAQDSGVIVNPGSAHSQISGMLVRGVSRTLLEQVVFDKHRVTSLDWVGYPTLRFKNSPTVTTIPIAHMDEVTDIAASGSGYAGPRYRGVGESVECLVPAAVGNAVFDATGVRLRQIPLTPAKVREALNVAGRLI